METIRRNSKKRQAIYEALKTTDKHPSAEQLYKLLKPEFPDLSLGTVYRNIGILMDEGLVVSAGKVNGEDRFDANTSQHAHFICSECGALIDISPDNIGASDYDYVENSLGGKVISHSLSFTGVCKNCLEKK